MTRSTPAQRPAMEGPAKGRLAANVMHFCRALRAAGLPVGPERSLAALEAVGAVGLERRADVYWALHATLVNRREQQAVFDQAFHLFWRDTGLLRRALAIMLPSVENPAPPSPGEPVSRRVADALRRPGASEPVAKAPPELALDMRLTFSDREALKQKDFASMSAAELAQARREIARLGLRFAATWTRRFQTDPRGPRIDPRATLRRSLRGGADAFTLARRRQRVRPPPLVLLCDISGSMDQYARLLLHFCHALATDRDRVHSFVFGTRLTNISRRLRHRDVDEALRSIGEAVADWSGGTRIGEALAVFNRLWSWRVLGQGAIVLLITDGLDRDPGDRLAKEMERLRKSCHRLLWLNPLLRYDRYAPRSMGARAMVPHVDRLCPVHNLDSLTALVDALTSPDRADEIARWRMLAKEVA